MTHDDVREEQAATFTRPELLRRAGAVAVSLGLGSAFAPQAFAAPEAGGDIKMLTWQGYDVQKAMKPFQKAHDLSFHATFIGNHDDIQAKVTQDPSGYNLITYYEGYHELYKQLNILSPIDPAKVPNLKNNYSQFKNKNWWVSDGKLWGVPWTWGSWTLNYNPAKMAAPTKWTDLLEPEVQGQDCDPRRPERRDRDRSSNPQAADPEPHLEATRPGHRALAEVPCERPHDLAHRRAIS